MIDSPFLSCISLVTTSTGPGTPVDPNNATAAMMLVDAVERDGALIESIELLQRVADDIATVHLYLAPSAIQLNVQATFLGAATMPASQAVGARHSFELPLLLAPVPHAASAAQAATELPQFRGLRIPRGAALWAAVNTQTASLNAPNIVVQGGWY